MATCERKTIFIPKKEIIDLLFNHFGLNKEVLSYSLPNNTAFTPEEAAYLPQNYLKEEELSYWHHIVKIYISDTQLDFLKKSVNKNDEQLSLKQTLLNRFQKQYILTEEDLISIVKEFLDLPDAEVNFCPNEQNKPMVIITERGDNVMSEDQSFWVMTKSRTTRWR